MKGRIFSHIIPYLKKHGVNPCSGKKLAIKDLIHLKFDKDAEGWIPKDLFCIFKILFAQM